MWRRYVIGVVGSVFLAGIVTLCTVTAATAAGSPAEQKCQERRYAAASKFLACEHKATGKSGFDEFGYSFVQALSKCRLKYAATWPKIQAASPGTSCDQPRFTAVDGTVVDRLTGLQWEQKTVDGGIHDVDDRYTWSESAVSDGDGTAFTTFLPALDSAPCFAGHCDWRLPTRAELETLVTEAFPCTTVPCIDAVFGPTATEDFYWTSVTDAVEPEGAAWGVSFGNGFVNDDWKDSFDFVRAVRGGL